MTLPAALQARLKKRGLIAQQNSESAPKKADIVPKKPNYKTQSLPPGWFHVDDPQTGHSYYWNVHTNQVSWRHPNDPRADVTYPASWQPQQSNAGDAGDVNKSKQTTEKTKNRVNTGKHPSLLKASRQKEKSAPYRKGKSSKGDDSLDPMDPASYSDVGRGKWSTGLKEDTEVKTGVDTTASGPLFQQRPYPSPGDILRRNKGQTNNPEET